MSNGLKEQLESSIRQIDIKEVERKRRNLLERIEEDRKRDIEERKYLEKKSPPIPLGTTYTFGKRQVEFVRKLQLDKDVPWYQQGQSTCQGCYFNTIVKGMYSGHGYSMDGHKCSLQDEIRDELGLSQDEFCVGFQFQIKKI